MTVRIVVNRECEVPGLEPVVAEELVERAVRAVLADGGVGAAELSLTLLDDPSMTALNREWKGRSEPTDVLAFPLYQEGEAPVGDIYIGVERVAEQGTGAGETTARELARVAVHGALHVLGWDHPEQAREASDMWRRQERILDQLGIP
jgi:probable rRNA maturation factor